MRSRVHLQKNGMAGLPDREPDGQQAPGNSTIDDLEDGVDHWASICRRTTSFGGTGEHGLVARPLGVVEVGFVSGNSHRPTELRLKSERLVCSIKSSLFSCLDQFFPPPTYSFISAKTSISDFSDTL